MPIGAKSRLRVSIENDKASAPSSERLMVRWNVRIDAQPDPTPLMCEAEAKPPNAPIGVATTVSTPPIHPRRSAWALAPSVNWSLIPRR